MDFRGVHHFVEGHGEFSLIKLLRIPDCFRCDTQLRLGQERGGETIGRWYRRYLRPGRHNEQLTHAHDQPAVRALISRQRGPMGRDEVACPASLCARIPRKAFDERTVDWHGGRALPNPRWREDRTIRCRRGTRWCWHRAANQYQSLMDALPWSGASS